MGEAEISRSAREIEANFLQQLFLYNWKLFANKLGRLSRHPSLIFAGEGSGNTT
jgi:hypothetical protein